jgi:hypothetical protein
MKVRVLAGLGVLLAVFAASVSSASAETPSPWFHLALVSRPGHLASHPGLVAGQNEVQEVTMSGEVLVAMRVGGTSVGAFATEPFFAEFGGFFPEPTAENVQAALEGAYGKGNVVVRGGPGGSAALAVESVGEDADRPVAPVEVTTSAGKANASVTTDGRRPQVDGYVVATAVNVGEADVDGSGTQVRVLDTLPAGLAALSAEANTDNNLGNVHPPVKCALVSAHVVECLYASKLPPYQQIELDIGVAVQGSAHSGEENEVSVSGGGAPPAHVEHPIVASGSPTPFGVEDYALSPEEPGGRGDAQAGSHPFQMTATFNIKQVPNPNPGGQAWEAKPAEGEPVGLAKDLAFRLPAGLIGNPTAVPRCTLAQFNAVPHTEPEFQVVANECPAGSVVGVATVSFTLEHSMKTATLPMYNLDPAEGEPARFGFQPAGVPVLLDTSVRTGEDYGVVVSVHNVPQSIGFISNTVTFWGVPGDARHDSLRGIDCLAEIAEDAETHGPCRVLEEAHPPPFLSLPTSCSGSPLETSVLEDSWADPEHPLPAFHPESGEQMPVMHGCGLLPFASEIHASPDIPAASTPSGLRVDVHVPQEEALNAEGLSPADVKNIVVALPEGLELNPSAADGLAACSLAQIGFKGEDPVTHVQEFTPDEPSCPDASKIATVKLKLPILPKGQYVEGFVYLAAPQNFSPLTGALPENPFSSLVALYLVARDRVSGIRVKLPMRVSLSSTGQITTTVENSPQAPFEDAEFEFFGGSRAPLATPARCRDNTPAFPGSYATSAFFEPWSNTTEHHEQLHSISEFVITSGPNGGPCPGAALPFSPSLASQTSNINAGSFTPLVTTLSREDGEQPVQSVTLHYPPGLSGIISGIPLCPEANANAGTCPAASLIGETIVSVGVGGDPFTVTGGKVYLTEKYAGSPFGLSIVNPAKAGPFTLQEGRPVVVRAKIDINPFTAALTVTTGAVPTIIEGFPLQIKHVNVTITRPGFTFNPTNCTPMSIAGTVNSAEGASSPVSVPFQVTNCAMLKFTPKFTVSTNAHTSKATGASLVTKLAEPAGSFGTRANITKVKVDLPLQLPSQLKTLQKACLAHVFETNPAACPPQSIVGHAKVITPLLPVPLVGPAYFVSHGNEAFPSLTLVLQGYGVTVELVGSTFIKNGITSSTFKTVPDAPFNTFELTLPQGKYAALAANLPAKAKGSFCGANLKMPTLFVAQNGLEIHQATPIHVQGCKAKHHTSKLQAALKACHRKHGHTRRACETKAHKRYGTRKK